MKKTRPFTALSPLSLALSLFLGLSLSSLIGVIVHGSCRCAQFSHFLPHRCLKRKIGYSPVQYKLLRCSTFRPSFGVPRRHFCSVDQRIILIFSLAVVCCKMTKLCV